MERPSRKTKVVNYCEAKDFEDDDFAPPSKKAKEDVKQLDHKKSSKSSSQESQSAKSQKRKPLDEKLHNRDLEAAITLSLLNNVCSMNDQSLTSTDVKTQHPVEENTDPSPTHLSNCSVDSTILGLDEITSEKLLLAPSKQRKPETTEEREKKVQREDEEYQPKLTPDSESDADFSEPDESEDEEFTVKKVSKTKKEKVNKNNKVRQPPASKKEKKTKPSKPKSQGAVSTPVRTPPAAKLAPKISSSSSKVSASKSVASLSPAGGKIPKWNPPGQIGKSSISSPSPAVKSPGQGLRLGLSRLVRVKPLHPSVTSH